MEMHTSASLQAIHGIDMGARRRSSFSTWLSKLLKRMQDAKRRRRDYDTLMAKSDYELRDIGLTRADVIEGFENRRWRTRLRDRG